MSPCLGVLYFLPFCLVPILSSLFLPFVDLIKQFSDLFSLFLAYQICIFVSLTLEVVLKSITFLLQWLNIWWKGLSVETIILACNFCPWSLTHALGNDIIEGCGIGEKFTRQRRRREMGPWRKYSIWWHVPVGPFPPPSLQILQFPDSQSILTTCGPRNYTWAYGIILYWK
jgi:hypothetical protein